MPYCNTDCMNVFLQRLSESYPEDIIVLVYDGVAWHISNALIIPDNIRLVFIPPYTPEMNPIEQIRSEIRTRGFKNEFFPLFPRLWIYFAKRFVNLLIKPLGVLREEIGFCPLFKNETVQSHTQNSSLLTYKK